MPEPLSDPREAWEQAEESLALDGYAASQKERDFFALGHRAAATHAQAELERVREESTSNLEALELENALFEQSLTEHVTMLGECEDKLAALQQRNAALEAELAQAQVDEWRGRAEAAYSVLLTTEAELAQARERERDAKAFNVLRDLLFDEVGAIWELWRDCDEDGGEFCVTKQDANKITCDLSFRDAVFSAQAALAGGKEGA